MVPCSIILSMRVQIIREPSSVSLLELESAHLCTVFLEFNYGLAYPDGYSERVLFYSRLTFIDRLCLL